MKPNKKVSFIESISKTELGLDGLEIVVECDRNNKMHQERVNWFKENVKFEM